VSDIFDSRLDILFLLITIRTYSDIKRHIDKHSKLQWLYNEYLLMYNKIVTKENKKIFFTNKF